MSGQIPVDLADAAASILERRGQIIHKGAEQLLAHVKQSGAAGNAGRFKALVASIYGVPPEPGSESEVAALKLAARYGETPRLAEKSPNGSGRVLVNPAYDGGSEVHPVLRLLNLVPITEPARQAIFREHGAQLAGLPIEDAAERLVPILHEQPDDAFTPPRPPSRTFTEIRDSLSRLAPQLRAGLNLDELAREFDRQPFNGDATRYVLARIQGYPDAYWRDPHAAHPPRLDHAQAGPARRAATELAENPRYRGL